MGGTQVRAALVDDFGTVLCRSAAQTDVAGGPAGVVAQFRTLVSEVCGPEERTRLAGVGISAPGPLDTETGTVLGIPTLPGWEQFPLRTTLADLFGLPIAIENDGIAAAFGEWRHGAGRGCRHLVYVTVSTGIGGGVVVDGRLLRGRRGMAGHVGHFRIDPQGPACSCGALGCFEAVASGMALDRAARHAMPSSDDCPANARMLAAAARQGDPVALGVLREEGRRLGSGFVGLIHLFSPERLIMGGGVSLAFDLLEPDIHAVIRRDAMGPFRDVPVVCAGLGENSGLVGAAALALEMTASTSSSDWER